MVKEQKGRIAELSKAKHEQAQENRVSGNTTLCTFGRSYTFN